jgi:glycosyltransferase involved in cell wall biosynthesis
VAASAPGPPPAAAGRCRLGARDHQRTEPRRAGGARHCGHDDLQRLRPGSAAGRARQCADRPGRPRWQTLAAATDARARKNIGQAIALAEALDATYWLLGPAEDGYGPELARLVALARCPVLLGATTGSCSIADAYAACDAVALPSLWEGFGNPSVESATYRRPLAIGPYPVATELERLGFRWFDAADPAPLARWLGRPDARLIAHNQQVAAEHFNLADLPSRLSEVLRRVPGL